LDSLNIMLNQVYNMDKKLPDDMDSSRYQSVLANASKDTAKISYRKINDGEFELCADFLVDVSKDFDVRQYNEKSWYAHKLGRQCFQQKPIVVPTDLKTPAAIQEFPNPTPAVQ